MTTNRLTDIERERCRAVADELNAASTGMWRWGNGDHPGYERLLKACGAAMHMLHVAADGQDAATEALLASIEARAS